MERFSRWYVVEDREFPNLSKPGSFLRRIRWFFEEDAQLAALTQQLPILRETMLPLGKSLTDARNLFMLKVKEVSEKLQKDTLIGFMTFSATDTDGDKSLEILKRKEDLGIRKGWN